MLMNRKKTKRLKRAVRRMLPDRVVKAAKKALHPEKKPVRDSYKGHECYTVVSPVYNVGRYLDDFFTSIYNQTMRKESIFLIMVDDGSTDDSARIIEAWKEKLPNITYVHKENGGQASARNLGMKYVETEWVTFPDPDDFLSERYFEEVDREIHAWHALEMVSCNYIFYLEDKDTYSDTHPLRDRFAHGRRFFAVNDDDMPLQLSMNSVFLRMSHVRSFGLTVDELIRPSFEDAHFVNRYLLSLEGGIVGFLPRPKYYYRKRSDASSTLDTAWRGYDRVTIAFERGCLDLLQFAEKTKGYVPPRIQKTVLYDVSYAFKYYFCHPERSGEAVERGLDGRVVDCLRRICSYIETQTLFDFPGRRLSFGAKYGIACCFKQCRIPYHIAYVKQVNLRRREILVETCGDDVEFFLDGIRVIPSEVKEVSRHFFGESLYTLREMWLPYTNEQQVLSYRGKGNAPVRLSVERKLYEGGIALTNLVKRYTKDWDEYVQKGDTWIILDRDTQADDNGEHFYRWMRKNHPEQRCRFALRKSSRDWGRLRAEGFDLVDFGSAEYEKELRACSKIISSHADAYVHSYFGDSFYKSKDFVFLQHGVTKDDISNWLNPKKIDLFVVTTPREAASIYEDNSPYVFTKRQVLLSGFPRHDALLEKSQSHSGRRSLLIAPTWRGSLTGKRLSNSNNRELNPAFCDSEYRKCWESVLSSGKLKGVADEMDVDVVFFPHANLLPYIEQGMMAIPDYVELGKVDGRASIQDYFARSVACITDYSSVAFEEALLGKPVLYYQFDADSFFSGGHIFAKGYFDYERDGFGPVAHDEDELLAEIERLASRGFEPEEEYARRMSDMFIFRDGKCCERVYDAIKALDAAPAKAEAKTADA